MAGRSDHGGEAPPERVLRAFRAPRGDVQPLAGGEETSARVGALVFKRVQDVALSIWCQELLARTTPSDVRIPTPIQSQEGTWAVDGWIATEFVEGLSSLRCDPRRVIEVGGRFSEALCLVAPEDLGPVLGREDRWARADRFVWGEESIDLTEAASEVAHRLRARTVETQEHSQIIHADLSGNVFIDISEVPVLLDFSPCVRPRRYASAIVVADNLLWHGAGVDIFDLIDRDEDALARGLLFRMAAEQLATAPRHGARLDDYLDVMTALGWI